MNHPIGYEKRLEQLTGPDATLHAKEQADETDEGYYYLTVRTWPHPDVDDAWTVSFRYAYLTKGDGGDGWTETGMNMRASELVAFAELLSELFGDFAEDVGA